jgi:peptidoglycan glycosyltransferase
MEGIDQVRNLVSRLLGREQAGGHLVLTVDAALQKTAADLLGDRRGAVVMLDTRTGAVRVMVSSPGFDPNFVDEAWSRLEKDPDLPLINRATQGAYPPGSIIKVVVAAGALSANPGLEQEVFNCQGFLVIDGYRLTDTAVHGNLDIKKALAVSCNTVFARLGLSLKPDGLHRAVNAFGLKKDPGLGIPVRPGTMVAPKAMTPVELAASAIGQGEMLVSPLHMALVAAGIANQGTIMHPFVVESFKNAQGQTVRQAVYRPWLTAATPDIAGVLKESMVDAVVYGTAQAAGLPEMQVAGKTGSAQNPHGQTHAWFIGFAPAEKPRLAVAVILENAGAGGSVAAPIAGKLFSAAAKRGY